MVEKRYEDIEHLETKVGDMKSNWLRARGWTTSSGGCLGSYWLWEKTLPTTVEKGTGKLIEPFTFRVPMDFAISLEQAHLMFANREERREHDGDCY